MNSFTELIIYNPHFPNFQELIKHFGYLGIFLFFISIDQLTPIPEEITLLTIGYLSSNHIFNPFIAGIASTAAFIVIDLVYFYLGRKGNKFVLKTIVKNNNKQLTRFSAYLKDYFGAALLIICFIPRMRLLAPAFAGIIKISLKKFLFFDIMGLLLFTGVYIALGIAFNSGLYLIFFKLQIFQHILFTLLMILLSIVLFFLIRKTQKN